MVRNPQQIRWATIAMWTLLVIGHLMWHFSQALAALPTDEVYVNGIGFQLIAFGLTKLPFWLLGLIALLLADFFLLRRR